MCGQPRGRVENRDIGRGRERQIGHTETTQSQHMKARGNMVGNSATERKRETERARERQTETERGRERYGNRKRET